MEQKENKVLLKKKVPNAELKNEEIKNAELQNTESKIEKTYLTADGIRRFICYR